MGASEKYLNQILKAEFGIGSYSKPSKREFLHSEHRPIIDEVYQQLGGILPEPPLAFRGYDIQLPHCIIEYDEEQHFNRYRAMTLASSFYDGTSSFDIADYSRWCIEKESECMRKSGQAGYWSKKSSDEQFGQSNTHGDLGGNGSSRWKQRAFYDFLRDVSAEMLGVPIIRIAMYEVFKNNTVADLIKKGHKNSLLELVELRMNQVLS